MTPSFTKQEAKALRTHIYTYIHIHIYVGRAAGGQEENDKTRGESTTAAKGSGPS